MIDKTHIIATVMEKLMKIPEGHCIDLRTYKRNRSVIIVKQPKDVYMVIEDGFFRERFHVTHLKIKKLLTMLLKREFPRSNKIRLYNMGLFSESGHCSVRRKIL